MTDRYGKRRPVIHLISNAHLDPVWLWPWEEGAAEAVSTFRTAADLCEQFDGYIFNHNEAILYEWVRQSDAELFRRIQRLVKKGRWHIMGGWYLQPDCNLPAGEALLRQALVGRQFFQEHFGVRPRTAINFDSFGHDRGVIQILRGCGYDSYIFGRPWESDMPLASDRFSWVGRDGSSVIAVRPHGFYLSGFGHAAAKIQAYMSSSDSSVAGDQRVSKAPNFSSDMPVGIQLWGVGNHGGGPSRRDLKDLSRLAEQTTKIDLVHSTPERFITDLRQADLPLPPVRHSLRHVFRGCYASMPGIKYAYRRLESEFLATERLVSHAWGEKAIDDPRSELASSERDLLFAQFHDILPGTGTPSVEADALRLIEHGRETLSRLRHRAFVALTFGTPASRRKLPIFVYNPHPFPVSKLIECELQLPDQNWGQTFTNLSVRSGRKVLNSQIEQEESNLTLDWRKRLVFRASLPASSMSRFDAVPQSVRRKPRYRHHRQNGERITIRRGDVRLSVDTRRGGIESFGIGGDRWLYPGSCLLQILPDSAESWGSGMTKYGRRASRFKLMTSSQCKDFSGGDIDRPVNVIEDGACRTIVECLTSYGRSRAKMTLYVAGEPPYLRIDFEVDWMEIDKALKLPFCVGHRQSSPPEYFVQGMFGDESLPATGEENVGQRWAAATATPGGQPLVVVNDGTYGIDAVGSVLRPTLLRSPAYAALKIPGRRLLPKDQPRLRQSQGRHRYSFLLQRLATSGFAEADRLAAVHNEAPWSLACSPLRHNRLNDGIALESKSGVLSCCKPAQQGEEFILRLYEAEGRNTKARIRWSGQEIDHALNLAPHEIKTIRVGGRGQYLAVDMTEQPIE